MTPSTLDRLRARFDAQAAQGMDEVYQFHFSDAGSYYLVIKDGDLEIAKGEHDAPSVSLSMTTDTLKGVMNREINGLSAFMSGRIEATGNVMLATRLAALFPSRSK